LEVKHESSLQKVGNLCKLWGMVELRELDLDLLF